MDSISFAYARLTPAVGMIQIMFEWSFEMTRLEQFLICVTSNAASSIISQNDFNGSVYATNCKVLMRKLCI